MNGCNRKQFCWGSVLLATTVAILMGATSLVRGQEPNEQTSRQEERPVTASAAPAKNQSDVSTDVQTTSQTAREQPVAEEQSETAQSVQEEVEKATQQQAAKVEEKVIKEAVSAVELTRKAIEQLDEGNTEEALEILAQVSGKLNLAIALNPGVAFLPVDVRTTVYDVFASVETVKDLVEQADKALDKGDVQVARRILRGLASEVVISTVKMPVATYPDAIKKVAPLIHQGKIEEAKKQLELALNLLVVSDSVYPLPVLRSNIMLAEAEKLAEKKDRTTEENKRLAELLDECEHQIKLGHALGYINAKRVKEMLKELDHIRERTSGNKSGKGFFDNIKQQFKDWEEWFGRLSISR